MKFSKFGSNKLLNLRTIFVILVLFWILIILCSSPPEIRGSSCAAASIKRDGFCVISAAFTQRECKTIEQYAAQNQQRDLMRAIFGVLPRIRERIGVLETRGSFSPTDYTFHNYIWNIRKGHVVTCHSDNNARRFNSKQKYPSYTVLVYPTGGCLGVIPRSHKPEFRRWFYWYNPIVDIVCEPGDVIVFDAELIHVGGSCRERENPRIQLKVSHKDDLEVLGYYQNYYKIIDKKSKIPETISNAQKNLSCIAPIISDMTQSENIKTARGSVEGAKIGWGQKLFSLLFYGDAGYYDLRGN